jgi:hypothetical protein
MSQRIFLLLKKGGWGFRLLTLHQMSCLIIAFSSKTKRIHFDSHRCVAFTFCVYISLTDAQHCFIWKRAMTFIYVLLRFIDLQA